MIRRAVLFKTHRDADAIIRPCLQGARLAIAEHAIDALRACILMVSDKLRVVLQSEIRQICNLDLTDIRKNYRV